jgi:hypothetical protein
MACGRPERRRPTPDGRGVRRMAKKKGAKKKK